MNANTVTLLHYSVTIHEIVVDVLGLCQTAERQRRQKREPSEVETKQSKQRRGLLRMVGESRNATEKNALHHEPDG